MIARCIDADLRFLAAKIGALQTTLPPGNGGYATAASLHHEAHALAEQARGRSVPPSDADYAEFTQAIAEAMLAVNKTLGGRCAPKDSFHAVQRVFAAAGRIVSRPEP
jgi:hypothetical protein